jgi:hypothetical protein
VCVRHRWQTGNGNAAGAGGEGWWLGRRETMRQCDEADNRRPYPRCKRSGGPQAEIVCSLANASVVTCLLRVLSRHFP